MRHLAILALVYGCHDGPRRAEPVRTAVVHEGELVDRVLLTGALHPMSAVDLVVPSTDQGVLAIRWMIEDGAVVKAGDRLLEFDASVFAGRLIDNHTQLRDAETQTRLLEAGDAIQLADKKFAVRAQQIGRDKARLQADLPADLVTARAAQTNQLALTQAEAAVRRAEKDLAMAVEQNALEERIKHIDLDKTRRSIATAEHAIDALVVKAPRDGVVVVDELPWTGRKFHVGDSVQPGLTILSLPDFAKPMEIHADVIDVDDGRVSPHMAGTCTLDAYPADPLACTVLELAPVAGAKEGHDSLRRAFSVTLGLAHGDPKRLRPGMSVKIELHREPLHALVIPRGAVMHDKPDRVRLGSGQLRDVTLRACDAQQCAVASGLADGDVVSIGEAP